MSDTSHFHFFGKIGVITHVSTSPLVFDYFPIDSEAPAHSSPFSAS